MANTINAITTGIGGLATTADSSGTINLQSAGSTVVAVTSGGVAVTGTMTVGGNAVLNAGTAVTVAQGGTGQTTAAAAFNALNPMTTVGDIIYEGTGPAAARLGIGTEGQVLSVASGIPAWATVSSSPTTAQVLSATAGANANDVGTYAFLGRSDSAAIATMVFGTNYAGSLFVPGGFVLSGNTGWNAGGTAAANGGFGGSALSGTWKAMGQFNNSTNGRVGSVMLRVA